MANKSLAQFTREGLITIAAAQKAIMIAVLTLRNKGYDASADELILCRDGIARQVTSELGAGQQSASNQE